MASAEIVLAATHGHPLRLDTQTIALIPSEAKKAATKLVLECPRCCWIFEASSPDKRHPNCSFSKPEADKVKGEIVEEPRVCRNPKCKKQFALYWHTPA